EKGYISYPRTDSEYMAEENISLVKEVLRKLKREDLIENVDRVGKRVFDKTKLTDHHAIIPLKDGEVGGDEGLLFSEIKKRFFAVFYPPHEYELLKVFTQVGKYEFLSVGKRVIAQGWKELYGEVKDRELPELKEKDQVSVKDIIVEKKLTKPPPHFTEAELLKLMEKLNLGTPATRAGIIETLKAREYIRVEKKSLISTQKGRELIRKLEGSKLLSVELTSEWEKELHLMYTQKKGKEAYLEFLERIKSFVIEEVKFIKSKIFEYEGEVIGACPFCGSQVVEKAKGYFCGGCNFVLWRNFLGKAISRRQAQALLSGKKVLLKGLKSQKGNTFDAYGKLDEDGRIRLEFLSSSSRTEGSH
ncbi:MAG: DNA topoisomerase, partial [Candidatus Aenigmatarchaeota archaeon]